MKRRYLCLFCIAILFVSLSAKTKNKKHQLYDCSGKIAEVVKDYDAKKYSRVKNILENAKIQCSGSQSMDTILYYLGMSYLKTKMFVEAKTQFDQIVMDFPNTPFYEEAQFRSALAVYKQSNPFNRDQKETNEAIRLFRDFLDSHSAGPVVDSVTFYLNEAIDKLAEKDYNAARFYQKVNEFESAVIYFKAFIGDFPESRYTDQAKLSMAEFLIKLDRKTEAEEVITELVANSKDKLVIAKGEDLKKRLK